MTDFEKAQRDLMTSIFNADDAAATHHFENLQTFTHCHFHFAQSFQRRMPTIVDSDSSYQTNILAASSKSRAG